MKNPIRKLIAKSAIKVFNYLAWEAGMRFVFDPDRGQVGYWPYADPQDPVIANDVVSRMEIIRKAQEHERNNPIVNRLVDVFELFTVGAGGMPIIPASSDQEWNDKRKVRWDTWCEMPDLTSLQSFGTLQGLCARRWPVDGRVLVNLTRSDTPFRLPWNNRPQYHPRIQLIESSRIKTPPHMTHRSDIIDGVQVDAKGRPVAWWFTERTPVPDITRGMTLGEVSYVSRPAEFIVDISEPMRPGEYHPFSFFAPILNRIQDLDELSKMAIRRAKANGRIANVYKTENGEIPEMEQVRRDRFSDESKLASSDTAFTEDRLRELAKRTGVESIGLRMGESVDQIGSKSPNEIEQAHWDIIVNNICAGFGVSKLLLFPNSMQGTVVRADLDISNSFFRARSAILQEKFLKIYEYVTDQECQYDIAIADRPFDWKTATIRPPRGCNVDVGRNSAAMISEYLAGMRTLRSIYAELGQDWKQELNERGIEEKFIDDLSKKLGIPPDRFRTAISESLKTEMMATAQDQAAADAQTDAQQPKQAQNA